MECEYCHTVLKTRSALNLHQKTAKYCLQLRDIPQLTLYACSDCGKQFTVKNSLDRHVEICANSFSKFKELKENYDKLNQKCLILEVKLSEALRREQEITKEYAKLAAIYANRPTTTNTANINTMNNISNITNIAVFDKSDDDIKRKIRRKISC
jgi:DNA-directed RNA polymerase subunit RPC12/RpoP